MDELDRFLAGLFDHGRVVFARAPQPVRQPSEPVERRLRAAYSAYSLDLPGPPIAFRLDVAFHAAEVVRQACWALLSRDAPPDELAGRVAMPSNPRTPSDHASADLALRYLPRVYRRARAIDPSDPLAFLIAGVLRLWPLSGVLAGIDDGPETPASLGAPGLMLLYAERFAACGRSAWAPDAAGAEYVALVAGGTNPTWR
jgi:hypothetical protein